jgi:hypothetical protein
MCLDTLKNIQVRRKNNKYYGYKKFGFRNDTLTGYAYNWCNCYPINQWISDSNSYMLPCDHSNFKYRTGFHIYLNKKGLVSDRHSIVKKVEFRTITAIGKQHKKNVVVAREIKILR